MKKIYMVFILVMSLIILNACQSYIYVDGKVNVVATTTMIGDLVEEIGQQHVAVTTLMGVGVDPHLYAPKAKDTFALIESDAIIYNGFHLEGKLVDVLDGLKDKKHVLEIADSIITEGITLDDEDEGEIDPHIWFDVRNWQTAARAVGRFLIAIDSANELDYQNNLNDYLERLEDLHQWTLEQALTLPESSRVLVTAHDAFGYFGQAYGFEVAAVQGISTFAEASIADINKLIDLIIEKNVPAIFVESSVPTQTINQVIDGATARGHRVVMGPPLFSDSLGDGIYSDYIEAFRYNVSSIISALKGEQ